MVSRDQTQVKRWCQAPLPAEPLVSPGSSFQSDMQRWVAKDTWVFGNRLPTFHAGTLLHLAQWLYFAFHEWLDNDLCILLQSLIQYEQNVPRRCLMNIPRKNFWVYPVFLLYSLSDSSGRCVRHRWAFKTAIHLPVELVKLDVTLRRNVSFICTELLVCGSWQKLRSEDTWDAYPVDKRWLLHRTSVSIIHVILVSRHYRL